MRKIILCVLAFMLLLALGLWRIKVVYSYTAETPPMELTADSYLVQYSKEYGSDIESLRQVMKCESSGRQTAVGDGGKAVGIFQYHQGTWEMFTKKFGEELDKNSYHDQAKLTAWAFSKGLQKHWTCFKGK